ncbi:MAG: HAD family hydrolase [Spirochaetales bacterium]|nr:HAD family hydrolase [Spirochaetales bacterium]
MNGERKGIIFDLDGTLADTLDDIAAMCNRGLAAFGFPPRTVGEYRRFVGRGVETLVRLALPDTFADEGNFPGILARVRREYEAGVVDKTRPYPGIRELLDALAAREAPMAVLSNKPHDLTVETVRRLFGAVPFAAVEGESPGRPHKPDPAPALAIAKEFGLAPEDVFLAGDSEVDVAAAKNAGMKAIAVTWGFRSREELARLSPFGLVDRPEEILDLFC